MAKFNSGNTFIYSPWGLPVWMLRLLFPLVLMAGVARAVMAAHGIWEFLGLVLLVCGAAVLWQRIRPRETRLALAMFTATETREVSMEDGLLRYEVRYRYWAAVPDSFRMKTFQMTRPVDHLYAELSSLSLMLFLDPVKNNGYVPKNDKHTVARGDQARGLADWLRERDVDVMETDLH